MGQGAIDQPRGRRFYACERGRDTQALAQRLCNGPYADPRSTEVQWRGWRLAMGQSLQRLVVGFALPDDVGLPHGHVHRLVCQDFLRHVMQDPISHVDRIREPKQSAGRLVLV